MSRYSELDAIRERYARRAARPAGSYSRLKADVLARVHERQRALISLLSGHGIRSLAGLDIVEVGCGSGVNLLEFLELGAEPGRLVGNELLPDRLAQARQLLPTAVQLLAGDASALPFRDASFDLVYQSTVFSSILDDEMQHGLAAAMWRWVKPGGAVLWYDFTIDNPWNSDVRGVPLKRVRELFPQGRLSFKRITLAPPLARRVARWSPLLYALLNSVPLLRTHVLCWIGKP